VTSWQLSYSTKLTLTHHTDCVSNSFWDIRYFMTTWVVRIRNLLPNWKVSLILLVLAVPYSIAIAYMFGSVLPYSALGQSYTHRRSLHTLIPEGWAFFTRNPREDKLVGFRYSESGILEAVEQRSMADPGFLWGIRRTKRAQQVELAVLATAVEGDYWIQCTGPIEECIARRELPLRSVELTNPRHPSSVCGEIYLVLQPPLPWAWWRSLPKAVMPSEIALVNVRCD
jgi:antimicrobial peptide system SdpA family protein